jgi:flagellar motor component MotA
MTSSENTTRQEVFETVRELSLSELSLDLDELIDMLASIREASQTNGYLSAEFCYDYDHQGYLKAYVKGFRMETQEEANKRVADEELKRSQEWQEYVRLKAKFENMPAIGLEV